MTQIAVKQLRPSATAGMAIVTSALGPAAWSNDFVDQDKYTTGSFYSGTNVTQSEAAGSHVAVQTGSALARGLVSTQHSEDTNGSRIVGLKSRGTRAARAAVASGDRLAHVVSAGFDGATYLESAAISFEASGAVAVGTVPQAIVFYTGTNSAPTEKFRLASSGTYVAQVTGSASATIAFATGAAPAQSGAFRLSNNASISFRNVLNTLDVVLVQQDASNNINVGQSTIVTTLQMNSMTNFNVALGGNLQVQVTTTRLEITRPAELSFARTVVNPQFVQQIATSGTASPLWIHAQGVNLAGADGDGGRLVLSGGKPDGTGLRGAVGLALNGDDVFANRSTMVEAAEVVLGNRIVSLCRGGVVSSTLMPANTGDRVTYVANRETAPSANPVEGGIMYANSGAGVWRGSGGTITTFGPA